MGFIANANGSIYAEAWTPEVQKLFAGQETPQGVLQVRPGRLRQQVQRQLARAVSMSDATVTSARDDRVASRASTSRALLVGARDARLHGWLFLLPALAAYGLFVLWPLVNSFRYSLYHWDGVGPAKWVGLANYRTVFSDPTLLGVLGHAFELIIYFCGDPGRARPDRRDRDAADGVRGRIGSFARTVLFLPQVVPLVAAGIAWSWVLSTNGAVNQVLSAVGLGGVTRAWLGDFS